MASSMSILLIYKRLKRKRKNERKKEEELTPFCNVEASKRKNERGNSSVPHENAGTNDEAFLYVYCCFMRLRREEENREEHKRDKDIYVMTR